MEVQASNCQVVQVQPLGFSPIKLSILAVVLATVGLICAQLHFIFGAIMPLYLLSVLYYLSYHNYFFGNYVLFKKLTWEDDFTYVSVKTRYTQVGSRANKTKLLVVKSLKTQSGEIIIKVKEQYYSCRDHNIKRLTQADILRLLGVNQLEQYSRKGLAAQSLARSTKIFGGQSNLFKPNILRVTMRYLKQQMGWVFLWIISLLAFVAVYLKNHNLELLLVHLSLDAFLFLLISIQSWLKLREFHHLYDWLGEQIYRVIRQGQELQLKLSQLLVGDVVCISWAQPQQEMGIYFKGVLIGTSDLNVRQEAGGKQIFKIPLRDLRNLEDASRRRSHVLLEGTIIIRQQRDFSIKIIVTERSLGKYCKLWFQKQINSQFDSLTQRITKQALWLLLAGSGGLVAYYIVLSASFSKASWPINKIINEATLTFIVFPLIFLVNQLVLLITNLRLKSQEIYALQPEFQRLGFCSEFYIQIKQLLELKFASLQYKNKILNFQRQLFVPDQATVRAGATHDSLLALVLYISLGQLDHQPTFLRQAFEQFKNYYEYSGPQELIDVTHVGSRKKWTLQKTFPKNEQGMRSWLIQYDLRQSYLITEFSEINEAIFNFLGQKQDELKKESYIKHAKILINEGRQLKAMFFRKLKEQKLKLSASASRESDYANQSRQKLENKYEFGSYIVFDNALSNQNINAINQLKKIINYAGQYMLNINFISSLDNKAVQGFQHIIEDIPIHPNKPLQAKLKIVKQSMRNRGTIYVSNDLADYQLQMEADMSIQIRAQKLTMLYPCDISIKSSQQLSTILQNARWLMESFVQNLKLAFAVVFFQILGLIYAERAFNITLRTSDIVRPIITLSVFVVIPTITREIASVRPSFKSHYKNIGVFSPNFLFFLVFAGITCFGWILVSGSSLNCHSGKGISLRSESSGSKCINLDIVMGSWAGVLYFCVFYSEASWIDCQDWGRMLLLPVLLIFLFINKVELVLSLGMVSLVLVVLVFKKIVRMQRQPSLNDL